MDGGGWLFIRGWLGEMQIVLEYKGGGKFY
jgi:hypothetical protein